MLCCCRVPLRCCVRWGLAKPPVCLLQLRCGTDQLTAAPLQIDAAAKEAEGVDLPVAFVTFNNRYTTSVAGTALQSHDETCWRVQNAPGPDEVSAVWVPVGAGAGNAAWAGAVAVGSQQSTACMACPSAATAMYVPPAASQTKQQEPALIVVSPRICSSICVQVVWTNLGIRFWERNLREIIMWAVLVVIIICFIPVTAALQAIIQVSA